MAAGQAPDARRCEQPSAGFWLGGRGALALILPITRPFTITCEPVWSVGFNKIGFMHTRGSIPAASACMTCALPISSPSFVTKEFKAIFWDLKGATRYPSRRIMRHSPATIRLLPAPDMVPCTIITFAIFVSMGQAMTLQSSLKNVIFIFSGCFFIP